MGEGVIKGDLDDGQRHVEEPAQVPLPVIPDFVAVEERLVAADDFLIVAAMGRRLSSFMKKYTLVMCS